MARDRMLFLISFAVLGLIAAFVFRRSDITPPSIPEAKNVKVEQKGDRKSLVLSEKPKDFNEVSPPGPGKVAVPYQLTHRSSIVQFMNPGNYVDVIFTSREDIGFGRVSLTLLRNIKILDIGKDADGAHTVYYKSNSPTEILLEMTPKQAQAFSYAELTGDVSLGISDQLQDEKYNELTAKLLESESDGTFHSILVTHMVKSLFPTADVNITATPKGYIATGRIADTHLSEKILKVLQLMAGSTDKSVVNLIDEHPDTVDVLVAQKELNPKDSITGEDYKWESIYVTEMTPQMIARTPQIEMWLNESVVANYINKGEKVLRTDISWPPDLTQHHKQKIQQQEQLVIAPGKIIVPFKETTQCLALQSVGPGSKVGIRFVSSADFGFETVSVDLVKDVRVVSIGKDTEGKSYNKNTTPFRTCSSLEVYLEMTPQQAAILTYAQSSGRLSLELEENQLPTDEADEEFVRNLYESATPWDFQSVLLNHMVKALFPGVNINITSTPKGHILEGKIPDPQIAQKIIEILARIVPGGDKNIVNLLDINPQQVLIHVMVLEVVKDIRAHIGLNWELLFSHNGDSIGFGSVYPTTGPLDPHYFLTSPGITIGDVNLTLLFDMLQENGLNRILAEPNITTVSGQTAHFFAGGEFPILIPQGGGGLIGTVTVEYKKYGVLMDFTPSVDLSGLITLHIVPEVSNIDRQNAVILQGFVIPALLTRRADTIVKLWPGQSYLIAGMLQDDLERRDDSLYMLDKIPILGPLFTSKQFEDKRTELIFVITPYLLNNDCRDAYGAQNFESMDGIVCEINESDPRNFGDDCQCK